MLGLRPRSSLIDRVLFDEEAELLDIRFKPSGRHYLYSGVPRAVFDALARASSAGQYFNETIKGRLPCRPAGGRFRPVPD